MSTNKTPLRNTAKTKQQYIAAWENHIKELTSVFYEAGIPLNEWDDILNPLYDKVHKAADNTFPEENEDEHSENP